MQEPLKEMMWPESPDWARCFVDGVVAVEMAVVRLVGEVYKGRLSCLCINNNEWFLPHSP